MSHLYRTLNQFLSNSNGLFSHHAVNTEEKSCYTEPSIDGGSHCGLATPANSVLNPYTSTVWGGEGERES